MPDEPEDSTASMMVKALLGVDAADRADLIEVFRRAGTSTVLLRQLQRYFTHHPDFAYKDEPGTDETPARRVYQKPEHEKMFGTMDKLVDLSHQRDAKLVEIFNSMVFERELRKVGLTRDQVKSYVFADKVGKFRDNGRYKRLIKDDPRAVVGVIDNEDRERLFSVPVLSRK
jgi:hypothetical protein